MHSIGFLDKFLQKTSSFLGHTPRLTQQEGSKNWRYACIVWADKNQISPIFCQFRDGKEMELEL